MNKGLPKDVWIKQAISRAALLLCGLLALYMMGMAVIDFLRQGQTEKISMLPLAVQATTTPEKETRLNLNTMTQEQLLKLPGIGEYLALQIILQRAKQPFFFIEDLSAVKGFGDKRIEALRHLVYVPLPEEELEE